MKSKHVFGGHVYLISNYGVARNPIFKDKKDLEFFKEKFDQYLGEICDLHASSHKINQFQYLVKIKEREHLEAFYLKKMDKKKSGKVKLKARNKIVSIPESYLIFSQEVSNFLNSVAKKFNFRHGRRGSLFADRYTKLLVTSEEEMRSWKERLVSMRPLFTFEDGWKAEELSDGECQQLETVELSEGALSTIYLRGCFESLPPKSINSPFFNEKIQNYIKTHGHNPPW